MRKYLFAFLVLGCLSAHGQLLTGRISGTVTDPSGASLQTATVEAVNRDTGLKVTALTQDNGLYELANLPIGSYTVKVNREGFQAKEFTQIQVSANRTTSVNAQLEIGAAATTIQVEASSLRNETDATVGYVLDSSTIQQTPLGTGSFTQLALLSPGVNADFLSGSGTNSGLGNQNIWANGQRDTSNSISLNGVSGNNLFNGKTSSSVSENRFVLNTGYGSLSHAGGDNQTSVSVYDAIGQALPTPAPETLQELRVNTAMYDSSQGGNSGAQIAMITRSGSNAYHGQLYEYFQNKALNAAPFFRNADPVIPEQDKVPALHYNRFGATLGGPIIRNKLFFFTAYQGLRDTDSVSSLAYVTVPQHLTDDRSAAAIANVVQQDFGKTLAPSEVSPVALKLLNYKVNGSYLIPSVSVTDAAEAGRLNFNAVQQGAPTTLTQNQGTANLDWNPSSMDRLSFKYFISDNPTTSPFSQSSSPGFAQVLEAGSQVASVDNTYVLSPTLLWEQRVGFARTRAYSRTDQALTPQDVGINLFGSTSFPGFTIYQADSKLRNSFVVGPRNLFGNSGAYQNRFTYASTLNWVRGRHSMSFGFQSDYVQLNVINPNNETATIESDNFSTFAAGTPLNQTYSYLFAGATNRYYRAWQTGVFAQDVFKLRPNLTFNLGLRLDYNGAFHEKHGNLSNFFPDRYSYNAATDSYSSSGILVAADNPTLGTAGVPNSVINGRQWGLAPRIGIAWSPGIAPKLTVRAGFGLFYDRGEYFTYLSPGAGRGISGPFAVTMQLPFVSQRSADAAGTLENPFGSVPPPPPSNPEAITALLPNMADLKARKAPYLFGGYDPNNVLPYTEDWSLDLQYQFGNSWLASLGYVGNHGVHQILPIPFNQPGIATASNPIHGETSSYGFNVVPEETVRTFEGGNSDLRVPYLGFSSNSVLYRSIGVSSYNALQAGLRKTLSFGLQLTASYTWSHTLDEQSGLGLFFNGNNPLEPKQSYGNSMYDRTHVFVASYLYQLPRATSNRGLGFLVNDWQVAGMTVLESGFPFNFYDYSGAVAGEYVGNTVSIADPIIGFTPGVPYEQIQLQDTTGVEPSRRYIDVSQLYIPAVPGGTNGVPAGDNFETIFSGAGRNTFRGPFQSRFDLSVGKSFRVSERFTLRFDADAFNVFNHASFDAPNNSTSLYSVSNGKPTVRGPSSSAGYISHTLGSPRFMQFVLHLNF